MSLLTWDQTGDRYYETGVKKGVLYPYNSTTPAAWVSSTVYTKGDLVTHTDGTTTKRYVCVVASSTITTWTSSEWEEVKGDYGPGVAWNGLSSVSESPSGAEESAIYADDIKYLSLRSAEELGLTIEAYTYPDEWAACDGSTEFAPGVKIGQQKRKMFGLCFRTVIGNDVDGDDKGYKLHLIYGATASPSERQYQSINDSPEAITFSWEVTTTPVSMDDYKPTAEIIIDSTKVDATKLATLEGHLYGTNGSTNVDATAPYLPMPSEIVTLFTPAAG